MFLVAATRRPPRQRPISPCPTVERRATLRDAPHLRKTPAGRGRTRARNHDNNRLPTTGELAEQTKVGSITVNQAVAELVREWLLTRRPRLGTFVTCRRIALAVSAREPRQRVYVGGTSSMECSEMSLAGIKAILKKLGA